MTICLKRIPASATAGAALASLVLILLLAACSPAGDTARSNDDIKTDADPRRLAHLQELAAIIGAWYAENRQLPPTLTALGTATNPSQTLVEALENRAYDYEVLGDEDYTLCARFDAASSSVEREDFWYHGAGEYCFRLSPTFGQY